MNTHADKTKENKSRSVAQENPQKQGETDPTSQFAENRPEAIAQRKLQAIEKNSLRMRQLTSFQKMANNSPQTQKAAQLQVMADIYAAKKRETIQKKVRQPAEASIYPIASQDVSGIRRRNVIQPKWKYDSKTNVYNQDVELQGYFWSAKLEGGKILYRTIEYYDWARGAVDYAPPDAKIGPRNTIVGAGWELNAESGYYEQETEMDDSELMWKVKVMNGDLRYHLTVNSEWDTPEEWIEAGLVPPAGVVFQEQRRQAEQGKSGAVKYIFEKTKLAKSMPFQVRGVQNDLLKKLDRVKQLRDEHKSILDSVINEEFAAIETKVDAVVERIKSDNVTEKDEQLIAEFFDEDPAEAIVEQQHISDGQIEAFKAGLKIQKGF